MSAICSSLPFCPQLGRRHAIDCEARTLDYDGVVRFCRVGRYLAIGQVALQRIEIALPRIAVTACSRQPQAHEIVALQYIEAFGLEPALARRPGVQYDCAGCSI